MAKLVCSMLQSLDGYVDHEGFAPGPLLFRHFIAETKAQPASIYGRRMYDIMRYWDDDQSDWGPDEQAFAHVWRGQKKWVVSGSNPQLGPNAALVRGDLGTAIRMIRDSTKGEVEVAGPTLAQSVADLGLIDEFRIYLCPVVLGKGTPFFARARHRLRLISQDAMPDDVVRLVYAPV